ncbi:DHH family phosphoesterase [Caldisericum exile]|uniref:Oligoribonuclease/3'-phosphoadenosine 5'-phosphate phosphatase n=1 Tax=Caldisericum exile (strain DSM 21853 / NBRC 104410 / AZM16c01) TaxID=511051 RepID=A0A7U6GF04_CALEA|nr:bifunctional oligoribonuclease/PAP phosphatase NrnA [Caldisericum exile]BAL81195.1 putative oligoribonuclease/3'-phosphoadenosine 5'-phosphate phosphatase [Caldisericum exile AZM16c01]
MESLKEIKNIISNSNSIFLTTHINADGDGMGSMLGLGMSLEHLGKKVFYFVPGEAPIHFAFLKNFKSINKNLDEGKFAEIFILIDAPNIDRVEGFTFDLSAFKKIIRIDHHLSNENFSHVKYVKVGYPSTSCLVFELIKELDLPIDKDIADALYTGLLTDTGSFRFNNTSEVAFDIARKLVLSGARPYYISRMVYEMETLTHLKLLGLALLRLEIVDKIGFSYITQEDFKSYNANENDTEGIVDYLRKEKDIEVVLFVRELQDGGYKGSLRSKNHIDVRKIAEIFGGGGHKEAAGFKTTLSKEEILNIVRKAIKDEEKNCS